MLLLLLWCLLVGALGCPDTLMLLLLAVDLSCQIKACWGHCTPGRDQDALGWLCPQGQGGWQGGALRQLQVKAEV